MAWTFQPGPQIPELFFWVPFRNFLLQVFVASRNAKSGFLSTLFAEFPGNATNFVGSAGLTLFAEFLGNATKHLQEKFPNEAQKKVPESAGLAGDDLAVL